MPDEIPYMSQVTNIPKIFPKIQSAGAPPKFTHEFLSSTLGFKGSGDRGIIKLMRSMGFLTADSTPTSRYSSYRSALDGKKVIADGIREAYPGVFLAETNAQAMSASDLTEIFKRLSGKGEAVAKKMAATFKALSLLADWSPSTPQTIAEATSSSASEASFGEELSQSAIEKQLVLHHDVHLHLPSTSDVAVFTAIFRALKDELLD